MKLKKIVDDVMKEGAYYCDIRKEKWDRTSLNLKDGEIEQFTQGGEEGAMVRVLYEDGWGYVGTSDFAELKKASKRALSMAKTNNKFKKEKTGLAGTKANKDEVIIKCDQDPLDFSAEEKISLLKDIEDKVKKDFVTSTDLRYGEATVENEIITSDGTEIKMKIPRLMVYIIITGKSDTIQRAAEGAGGTGGFELTEEAYKKIDVVTERLSNLLDAGTPPSGNIPLIMDPSLAGVFAHEAFGHAAEGDLVSGGNSCLKGRIGDEVAAEGVTISDDPTVEGYGHFPYDDEGTKAKKRVLVKNGKMNDFILDRESAWKLDMEPNGGARAEDFRVKPLVRMSNTIIEPGDMKFQELVEEVDKGIYAKSSIGGQVNPAQGTFQFNAQEGYLIEGGEIKEAVRDVSFNGFTLETLQNIVGIADDFESSIGHCGKGQTASVGEMAPHILISDVTVGGR